MKYNIIFGLLLINSLVAWGQQQDFSCIIPRPNQITYHNEKSDINGLKIEADIATEYSFGVIAKMQSAVNSDNKTLITRVDNSSYEKEEYQLEISKNTVTITVSETEGFHHAITTLQQIYQCTGFPLPIIAIRDKPKSQYRGMHLDVSRHFFTVPEVKKYIDFLARYKFNHFHWHLTDDQGWRIEIQRYPLLTEVGGYRQGTLVGHYNDTPQQYDGKRYGGFYTQAQVKEIVNYASDRSITVIPEIEMPGHALAAIAAYPSLACHSGEYKVAQKWGVFEEVFCPTEKTFSFLQDVLDEVVPLFNTQFIHIGGDECPKESWKKSAFCQQLIKDLKLKDEYELQAYFIQRIAKYLKTKHNKNIIGWDEILEGDLLKQQPDASSDGIVSSSDYEYESTDKPVIMSWRGTEGGIAAAQAGHYAIMTPGSHCYFDHYQSQKPTEPIAIGGYTDIKKVYHWDVIPKELTEAQKKYIIGGQANVWTEYIKTFDHVEYMAYARGMAMSEALWSTDRDYVNFIPRFELHHARLVKKGMRVANHVYELRPTISSGSGKAVAVNFELPQSKTIVHTLNGKTSKPYRSAAPFDLTQSGTHTFTLQDTPQETTTIVFQKHLGTSAMMTMTPEPSGTYKGNGPSSILNGVVGSDNKYGGTEWLGFSGKDVVIDIDLLKTQKVSTVKMRFFNGPGQWIYLPKSVMVETSIDGKSYTQVSEVKSLDINDKIGHAQIKVDAKTRYIRLSVKNFGIIPDGAQGGGHEAWLFIDEVIIE
jgi:hexosaminidase